ncbi:uncharacterized protein LDX57_002070 [Aspergillus melleus]|uniref:uncharacterized protein n=1 Tax=Aspergillus melleus TaxID=138277 RepID=UPI001E8ED4EA|nr:uncharacterized protein LDX57_002070 [Aspergillus melleus]KAH8424319.1 hypothetical protein LDX57_002070 [Aspergillus melleus]
MDSTGPVLDRYYIHLNWYPSCLHPSEQQPPFLVFPEFHWTKNGGEEKGWLSPLSFPLLISYGVFSISSSIGSSEWPQISVLQLRFQVIGFDLLERVYWGGKH